MANVIIADDSIFMRNIMKKIFTKHGFNVIAEAENGKIAYEKYMELRPDVITLDITMNEMNGLEALKKIIQFDRNARAIMVSAMGQKSFVQEAIVSGAKGFLVKPLTEEVVISTVVQVLKLNSNR